MIDLGAWAEGKYTIPTEPASELELESEEPSVDLESETENENPDETSKS